MRKRILFPVIVSILIVIMIISTTIFFVKSNEYNDDEYIMENIFHFSSNMGHSVEWCPGKDLISVSSYSDIDIWSIDRERIVKTIEVEDSLYAPPGNKFIYDSCWSEDGEKLAYLTNNRVIKILNTGNWNELNSIDHDTYIWSNIKFNPSASMISAHHLSIGDISIKIYSTDNGSLINTIGLTKDTLAAASDWSSDGAYYAHSENNDLDINIVNTFNWSLERTLSGHSYKVICLEWSPNGKYLVF